MTTATLTPYDLAEASQVGRRTFRKQILPKGSIDYKGRKITFDDAFLTDLAESFTKGAYDQVPVVFADPDNRHNMDPKRFGGEVKGFEMGDDGLDAIIEFTEDGAEAVSKNPRLGVSARIVEGLAKADGRAFKRAVQHVLLTMDPRVTGMRPWEAVELSVSDDATEVVDLTAATYQEETPMGKKLKVAADKSATTDEGQTLDLSKMSDEDFEALLELTATAVADGEVEDLEAVAGEEDEAEGESEEDAQYVTINGKRYKLVEDGVESTPIEELIKDTKDDKPKGKDADLSEEVVDSSTRDQVAQMRIDLASERWETERKELLREGVPPFLLDLAAPVLSAPDATVIDLANEDKPFNATETIRKMLDGVKGYINLTPEIGHQVDLSKDKQDADEAILAAWDKEYGTV